MINMDKLQPLLLGKMKFSLFVYKANYRVGIRILLKCIFRVGEFEIILYETFKYIGE